MVGREVNAVPRWWLMLLLRWLQLLLLLRLYLVGQLRKLRPIKVVGRLDCVVSTHVPNSH